MLNCRQGDLAVIVRSHAGNEGKRMTLEEAAIANGWARIRASDGALVWRAEEVQPGEVWDAAIAVERERCAAVVRATKARTFSDCGDSLELAARTIEKA